MDPVLSPCPDLPPSRPPVLVWFRIYCAVLCLIYLLFAGFSLVFFFADPEEMEMGRPEAVVVGGLFLVMGMVFFVASILPLLLRPRPWVWVCDPVIIGIGMTSACFLPFCVPLPIFWIKPEVKAHFGRQ